MTCDTVTLHQAFWQEIRTNPLDSTPWLIYADWLEGQAQSFEQAELIRIMWSINTSLQQKQACVRLDLWQRQQELLQDHNQWLYANLLGVSEEAIKGIHLEFCPDTNLPIWPIKARYENLKAAIDVSDYGYVNFNITANNFGIKDREIVIDDCFFVLGFDEHIQSDPAIERFEALNLQAVPLPALTAFGAAYPEAPQRERAIIGLGSSWINADGDRYVPSLGRWGGGRGLYLRSFVREWDRHWLFLAVRKV